MERAAHGHVGSFESLKKNRLLLGIIALAFVLRALFWLFGAELYYGPGYYINNDTMSYLGFVQWFENGVYTFDPAMPNARFGRVPVYPMFYGLHYLLSGFDRDLAFRLVAASQLILDVVAVYLLYLIAKRATDNERGALACAALYACYPFIIVWTPVTGTESFATFLSILTVYCYQRFGGSTRALLPIGMLIGCCLLTREYLGLLLPGISLMILLEHRTLRKVIPKVALLTFGMLLIYGLWPARNYFLHGEAVWLRPENSGYHRYEKDITRARYWINGWHILSDDYLNPMTKGDGRVDFPDDVFVEGSEFDEDYANELVELGRRCGRGFYSWQHNDPMPEANEDCTDEVAEGFNRLIGDYVNHHPFDFWVTTPSKNFKKIFFKSGLTKPKSGWKDTVIGLLFAYRTFLVLLGFVGVWVFRRTPLVMGIATATVLQYVFLSFGLRAVEMRYLLQFECLMLIPTGLLIARWLPPTRADKRLSQTTETATTDAPRMS